METEATERRRGHSDALAGHGPALFGGPYMVGYRRGRAEIGQPMSHIPASYPEPNQGETSGDPSEIECPTCGKANDVTGDPISEGDELECVHCEAKFEVTGVVHSVTITVQAKLNTRGKGS